MDLVKKTALVCGSTSGIGKATAIALANCGASVVLIARNENKLNSVLQELPNLNDNQKHEILVADFTDPENLKGKIDQFVSSGKTVDILVNNTGGPPGGPIRDAAPQEFLDAFNQHLICNQILVQGLYPGMVENKYGRIINIISTSVKQPIEGLGVSNTVRGAVANWSKTLATELGPFGITVNNILPGATATERLTDILHNVAKKIDGTFEDAENMMKNVTPAKRFAQPEEIANAIVFLASHEAGYINGINLPVDGGRTKSL
jgi:3-oxoacyl-[acyl-carrier protein] reductase